MSALPSTETSAPVEADQARDLFEQYSNRIFGYCLRRLPTREEAEDAVQSTFLNAFRGLRRGVVPRSEAAWLFRIAENVCRERRRAAWRRSRIEAVEDPEGLEAHAVAPQRSHDELAGLADALAELPPNQRRAILLREWQGLSYREIAEQLEVTESAVETLLFRARRSLARKLDRSRNRVWALDLGSLLAWGKSLLGGTAAKLAAVTIVAAGVTAATPELRHELASVLHWHHSGPARHLPATPTSSQSSSPAATRAHQSAAPGRRRGTPAAQQTTRTGKPDSSTTAPAPSGSGSAPAPATSEQAPGSSAPSAPSPTTLNAGPVSVTVPPAPPIPNTPPPTSLPVQLPPPPPLPVASPAVPPVQPPDLPDVPTLPLGP